MRILYVVNSPLGFLKSRAPLAKAAMASGMEVHVACPPGKYADDIASMGAHLHPYRLERGRMNPLMELTSVRDLARVCREVAPHLTHHIAWKPIIYGGMAARRFRVPAVLNTVTGFGYAFSATGWRAIGVRYVLRCLTSYIRRHPNCIFIAQNRDDQGILAAFFGLPTKQIQLIGGSGVDLNRFRPTPQAQGPPLVVLPSRLLVSKGVLEFVRAASRIKAGGSSARFALVGDVDPGNPDSVELALVEAWVREGLIEWWGWQEDMHGVLSQAAIVCLPSYREGVPRVLLEAAACGRPIVTTDAPGCRDTVIPGETGLLVPVKNAGALERALESLIRDASLRARMGATGRRLAEKKFSEADVIERTLALYRELSERAVPRG